MLLSELQITGSRDAMIAELVAVQGRPRCARPRSRAQAGPRATTERGELQQWVADAARWLHILHYHTHDSRHSEKGFPDSVFTGRRTLFRELKAEWATLTPEQEAWGAGLLESGQDWAVWRPSDWFPSSLNHLGLIRTELQAITFGVGRGH